MVKITIEREGQKVEVVGDAVVGGVFSYKGLLTNTKVFSFGEFHMSSFSEDLGCAVARILKRMIPARQLKAEKRALTDVILKKAE